MMQAPAEVLHYCVSDTATNAATFLRNPHIDIRLLWPVACMPEGSASCTTSPSAVTCEACRAYLVDHALNVDWQVFGYGDHAVRK